MKWVTREHPKLDRIARPWLIRRFIEKDAEFVYVPTEQVVAVAAETGATPYDIPGAEPFSQDGELRGFDTSLKHYNLNDPAPRHLALIVRGADTARADLALQAAGLLAISLGLQRTSPMITRCLSRAWSSTTRSIPGARACSARRTTGNRLDRRHKLRRPERATP